jgi:nucleotide-binding universal stress UspA family protein
MKEGDIMRRNRWIVVGMDFSEGAVRAFQHAVDLAGDMGASVACVHAYEDGPTTSAFHDPGPALIEQMRDIIARSMPRDSSVRVDHMVRRGAPWEKLVNVAMELGADLIVVGSDGQRGASQDGFLGTVASRLATTSPRSVVVIPTRAFLPSLAG